jgi:hypothetical protein
MIRRVHDSVIAPLSQGEMSRNDETWKNRGPGAQSEQGRIMARRTKGSAPLLRNKSRGPGRPARERSKDDETWKNRGPGAQSEQEKTMVGGIMAPGYCGTNPAEPAGRQGRGARTTKPGKTGGLAPKVNKRKPWSAESWPPGIAEQIPGPSVPTWPRRPFGGIARRETRGF